MQYTKFRITREKKSILRNPARQTEFRVESLEYTTSIDDFPFSTAFLCDSRTNAHRAFDQFKCLKWKSRHNNCEIIMAYIHSNHKC